MSRRRFLAAGAAGAVTTIVPMRGLQLALGAAPRRAGAVIVLFLRGGFDGLSAVAPVADARYAELRPTIAVPRTRAIPLDRTFGLHPKLAPLDLLWRRGDLAVIHAVGLPDGSRSHFTDQDAMERAAPRNEVTGWLARHLATSARVGDAEPDAVAIGSMLPGSLRGAFEVPALTALEACEIHGPDATETVRRTTTIEQMYTRTAGAAAAQAGTTAIAAVRSFRRLRTTSYAPAPTAVYPATTLGRQLTLVARLLKSDLGLEAATVDVAGWDLHAAAGNVDIGAMATLLDDLARSLSAFWTDLGERNREVTVVTVSEFGRRIRENGSNGTDHGHGNAMFVIGRGIKRGRVLGRWPGLDLATDQGDVPVTTDTRDVLAEIVSRRLGNPVVDRVFPGHVPRPVGVA